MTPAHEDHLFLLALDDPAALERAIGAEAGHERRHDAARMAFEGLHRAVGLAGLPAAAFGLVVDAESGAAIAEDARRSGLRLALRLEASDQDVFDFAFGDEFARHVDAVAPDLVKVLVRWHPDDDPDTKKLQAQRLTRLGAWLHETGRELLFDLVVPAFESDLDGVDGDRERYEAEILPGLALRALREIRDLGVEPDIWCVEGPDGADEARALVELARDEGRDHVVVLTRSRTTAAARADQRLITTAPVDGLAGFVIGEQVWATPLANHRAGAEREATVTAIADEVARLVALATGSD